LEKVKKYILPKYIILLKLLFSDTTTIYQFTYNHAK